MGVGLMGVAAGMVRRLTYIIDCLCVALGDRPVGKWNLAVWGDMFRRSTLKTVSVVDMVFLFSRSNGSVIY
jgi:hypothetical protein